MEKKLNKNRMNYILCTPNITKIGGAQLYILRRIKYLIENYEDINIILLTIKFHEKDLILKEFKKFNILEVEERILYDFQTKKNVNYLYNILKERIVSEIETIIESTCFAMKTLEIVSNKLKAKFYIYLTIELPFFQDKNLNFYLEKMKRGELIGVSRETLRVSFGKYYEEKYNKYVNIGFDLEEVGIDYIKMKELKLEKNTNIFRILIISRLEKKYVEKTIKEVLKISKKYLKLNIELIIIGDSTDGKEKVRLEKEYYSTQNLKIRFLGYLNPLFRELYLNSDLFIGMGTSLVNAAAFGCTSLGIDPRNSKASGFLGIDLFSFGYPSNDKTYNIADKIEEYLSLNDEIKNIYKKKTLEFFKEEYDFKTVMKKLDSYIIESKLVNKEKLRTKIDIILIFKYYLKIIIYKLKVEKYIKKIYKRKKFLEM